MKKILMWLVVIGIFAPSLASMGGAMVGVSVFSPFGAAPEIAQRAPTIMNNARNSAKDYLDGVVPVPAAPGNTSGD